MKSGLSMAFLLLIGLSLACDDLNEAHYTTMSKAISAGTLVNWIPPCVPRDCTDIYIRGDVDLSIVWARMTCTEEGLEAIASGKKAVSLTKDPIRRFRDTPTWWDVTLGNDSAVVATYQRTGEVPFPIGTAIHDELFIIDRERNRLYYWRSPSHSVRLR